MFHTVFLFRPVGPQELPHEMQRREDRVAVITGEPAAVQEDRVAMENQRCVFPNDVFHRKLLLGWRPLPFSTLS